MSEKNDKYYELSRQLIDFMDGSIDPERFNALQEELLSDASALQYSVEFMSMWALLDQEDIGTEIDGADSAYGSELWEALAEEERTAESVEVVRIPDEKDSTKNIIINRGRGAVEPRRVSRLALSFIFGSIAAMLFVLVLVRLYPLNPAPFVAKLRSSVDAEWLEMSSPIVAEEDMRAGFYELSKGFVEIEFDDGGEVIIEGPSRVKLESSKSIFLEAGKLSAYVPERATGFTVNTPGSTIVDLGTEFGVSVEYDGTSDVFMFQGKASLIAGRSGDARGSRMISVGEAFKVDGATSAVREIEMKEGRFARRLDPKTNFVWRGAGIDLADIVGGGNGFGTGRLDSGIDPVSGRYVSRPDYSEGRSGDGSYVAVPQIRYIDGVFVPDGGAGDVQIDSAGHTYTDCPDTGARYWTQITNGSKIGATTGVKKHTALSGKVYGIGENLSILMVPNVGITFDLDEIRKTVGGMRISAFNAICGLSSNFGNIPEAAYPKADFVVFVDGQKRFAEFRMTALTGPKEIRVDISERDRFLTLVATEGGDTNGQDWLICGEPVLELERTD